MEDYRVKIIERLSTVVTVREDDADSAVERVQGMYRNSEIVLTADDYVDTEVKVIGSDENTEPAEAVKPLASESNAADYCNALPGMKQFYRYSLDMSHGGIVIATDKDEAKHKVAARYKDDEDPPGEILIWDIKEDEFFDEKHPEVMDCY